MELSDSSFSDERELAINSLLQLPAHELSETEKESVIAKLSHLINELLLHDFNKLIFILYRVDVNESKLRLLLRNNPDKDASLLIANELYNRQAEKIKARRSFSSGKPPDGDEAW